MYNSQFCTHVVENGTALEREAVLEEGLDSERPVILFVSDSPRESIYIKEKLYFQYKGNYRIERCKNAAEALEWTETAFSKGLRIVVCIADLHLKGINGIELLQCLKKSIGKILLIPYREQEHAETCINQQFIDYFVTKPCGDELFRNIDHLVTNRKRSIYSDLPHQVKSKIKLLKTPFFLYNLDKIRSKVDAVHEYIGPDRLFYAVKCSSLPGLLETFKAKGCGFEVNNMGEMEKISRLAIPPHRIINSSPITSAADVAAMYFRGVRYFAFDAKSQIDNLKYNAPGCKVYLRINTSNEGSRVKLNNRLGADPITAVELLRYAEKSGLKPYGITFHAGSQCGSLKNWKIGLEKSAKLFNQFSELKMVNIGGGIPVNYNESIPSLKEIASVIKEAIQRCFNSKPLLFVEPGRFLVGDAALTCTSVIHVEESDGLSRAVVDMSIFSGLIELLEIGQNFQYPLETDKDGEKRLYQIVGPTCAGTDIIAKKILLPRLKTNYLDQNKSSRLYILNTGAYSTDYFGTRHPFGFNGSSIPDVYYVHNEKLVREDVLYSCTF